MLRRDQAAPTLSKPLWLRCLTVFCVLLVLVASSAQAAHNHGKLFFAGSAVHASAPDAGSQVPGGEEHCQLCQAMHSALPAAGGSVPVTLPVLRVSASATQLQAPEARWQFAMFSRPPPSSVEL